MFQHDNPSLSSITSDELRWLDANALILQESPTIQVTMISPTSSESARNKPFPHRSHNYLRSTKSSSAKAVPQTHRLSSNLSPKRPNHSNLRSSASPTPLSTPSFYNTSRSSLSARSELFPSTDSLPSPRFPKRSHSPSVTPPRSPEWIYRRPKSPNTPPSARYRRRPEMNRSASESSATSLATSTSYFSEINSSSPLISSPNLSYSEVPESPTLWTSFLRTRKRSGSVNSKTSVNTPDIDIPSLWFGADDVASRPGKSSGSRFLRRKKSSSSPLTTYSPVPLPKSPSLLSMNSPISKHTIRVQRTRSSSVSSSISSISTATSSSVPRTPTSPSLSPSLSRKFKPHQQCILEDNEPEPEPEDKLMGLGAIRRKDSSSVPLTPPSPTLLSQSLAPLRRPKLDVGSCSSSSKSVKFAETPTVHYASAGYDPDFWHIPGESMDTEMEDDEGHMDIEDDDDTITETGHHNPKGLPIHNPYVQPANCMDVDEPEQTLAPVLGYRPEDRLSCITPTPDSMQTQRSGGLKRIVSKSIKRQPSSGSTWRSTQSSSSQPSKPTTPRPAISGPFVLGSTSSPYDTTSRPPRGQPRSKLEASGIALRGAPSLESFRSVKSSSRSIRSLRSLRSLKSLPESVKSSIEDGAREMKQWFKGRMSIGVSAL